MAGVAGAEPPAEGCSFLDHSSLYTGASWGQHAWPAAWANPPVSGEPPLAPQSTGGLRRWGEGGGSAGLNSPMAVRVSGTMSGSRCPQPRDVSSLPRCLDRIVCPPKFICWCPNPQGERFGGRACRGQLSLNEVIGWDPTERDGSFIRGRDTRDPRPTPTAPRARGGRKDSVRTRRVGAVCKPGRGLGRNRP